MKRIVYISLIVCICAFSYYLCRNNSCDPQIIGMATIQDIDTQDILTISMDKNLICYPIIGNGVTQFYRSYKFYNKTGVNIDISWSTWLELSVDGIWYKMSTPKYSNDSGLIASTWRAYPGNTYEYVGDYLSAWRSQLKPGKYRRVWTAYFESDEIPFYAAVEFIVI